MQSGKKSGFWRNLADAWNLPSTAPSALNKSALEQILLALRVADGGNLFQSEQLLHTQILDDQASLQLELRKDQWQDRKIIEQTVRDAILRQWPKTQLRLIVTVHQDTSAAKPKTPNPYAAKGDLPGIRQVKKIIAVASGKGGVGKSTTAVNLAIALSQLKTSDSPFPIPDSLKIGLLDCDIYGPSIPRMLGINQRPEILPDKKMRPISQYGLQLMSMGFLMPEESANIWRGPMVMGAVTQMLGEVEWGELDFLIVDMPPGTGDAQLTLAQRAPLAGAVIVSTPQDIALIDARKAISMFRTIHVPILGIVENMSYFHCPHCQERSDIFAHGGARAEAEKLAVPFLGEIPLALAIRESGDAGTPFALDAEMPEAKIFARIAKRIMEDCSEN